MLISLSDVSGLRNGRHAKDAKDAAAPPITNYDKWTSFPGSGGGFTRSEKIITMTWIFGDAYAKICGPAYRYHRRSAFLKTGCLCTLTGKNDHMVQVLGTETQLNNSASKCQPLQVA